MSAQVLALRPPRRPSSDPHARLLDLEAEVSEQLAIGRRVGQRLNELEAERAELEAQVFPPLPEPLTEAEACDLIALGCALEGAPMLAPEGR